MGTCPPWSHVESAPDCYVYLLRSKSEALKSFIHYKKEVKNQLNKKINVLRSDQGGEYESPMGEFCS